MEVYLIERDNMKRVPESELDTEANLEQRLVRTDGAQIGEVKVLYVARQESPGEGGIFDILGVDKRGNTVIVELKRDRAPRDIVAQALEYASEIRNVEYDYLDERYRGFLREEQGYADPAEMPTLRDAHAEYFDLDETLSEREFNDEQRLVVVGTDFQDVSLNMADFLRDHGIDVVAVEYSTYRDEEEGVELLTTDGIRRPLSEEPTSASTSGSRDYADYSFLTEAVCDRVFSEVAEMLHLSSPEEVSTTESRLEFQSHHPDHLDEVRYRFSPSIEEKGKAWCNIGVYNAEDERQRQIYGVLDEFFHELDGYELTDNPTKSLGVVSREYDVPESREDIGEEWVEEFASALLTLIEHYHPKFVEEFGDNPSS